MGLCVPQRKLTRFPSVVHGGTINSVNTKYVFALPVRVRRVVGIILSFISCEHLTLQDDRYIM